MDRAWVDEGPTLKRWRPRAHGRATKIRKRTSHITLVVRSVGRGCRSGSQGQPVRVPARGHLPVEVQLVRRRDYSDQLHEDIWIRKHIRSRLSRAGISSIDIERKGDQIRVYIRTARPGIVIGRKGAEVDKIRKDVERCTKKRVDVKVEDMNPAARDPARDRRHAARAGRRRAARRPGVVPPRDAPGGADRDAIRRPRRAGAVRRPSGRRGDVAAASGTARAGSRCTRSARRSTSGRPRRKTTFGRIGVKVWVYHGDEIPQAEQETERPARPRARAGLQRRRLDGRAHHRRARGRRRSTERGRAGVADERGRAAEEPRERGSPGEAEATAPSAAARQPGPEPASLPPTRHEPTEGAGLMLAPKKVKHRKVHRGRRRGRAKGGTEVHFGDFGLVALEAAWITNRQIEAARVAITRHIRRGGKVWINIFPDKPFTKKPAETRMGSGKGNPEGWVAVVKPGRVMFELSGVPETLAREAMRAPRTSCRSRASSSRARGSGDE